MSEVRADLLQLQQHYTTCYAQVTRPAKARRLVSLLVFLPQSVSPLHVCVCSAGPGGDAGEQAAGGASCGG